jgi:outer membrane protein OmpA-like peptidoglycan-associated protein
MNFTKRMRRLWPVLLAGSPLLGCAASQAPKELVDARAAYTHAETGYAKEYSPASLHEAKSALDHAEAQFSDNGDSALTRDTAYVATRKAEMADAQGMTQHYQRELEAAKQQQSKTQAQNAAATQQELAKTKEQLAQEQAARREAEQRSNEALDKLAAANAAAVKHESRGTVITLSGGVLFASGKSVLLPGAQSSLNQVAEALKAQSDTKLLIEGHTDSKGSDETNLALSKARAEAVQSYLASRGIPADRMTANGLGSSRPVADNNTPEGRANNRRVEIVVQPPSEPR